jgi:hypothetical protein
MMFAMHMVISLWIVFQSIHGEKLTSSPGLPEQIMLSFGSEPSIMVVIWSSFTSETVGVVQYGTSEDNLSNTISVTGNKYTMKSYTSPMIYKATMTNLKPGNYQYYYRVGSNTTGYSNIYSFKSHPGIGIDVGSVTYHIFGDLGQTTNSETTLYELNDNENALQSLSGGIISMGDLSYANGDEPLWDSFGNLLQYSTATIPVSSTIGNHEWFDDTAYNFTAFKSRYKNPTVNGKEELYYSFNVGLVHWVMVAGYCTEMKSTSTQPCLAAGSPEATWLQNDLANVDKDMTPWVVVVFHQPYVNSNSAHSMQSEGKPMQEAIEDILYNSKVVDLVLSGHVHAYERSCKVYKYECINDAPYYITIGDGGNAEGLATSWINPQPSWSIYRQASYGHGEFMVYNTTHALWQWHQNQDLSPVVADEFWMIKGNSLHGSMYMEKGITKEPIFADNERGRKAAQFDEEIRKITIRPH